MAQPMTVGECMTEAPLTTGLDQTLTQAASVMSEARIRHLPVLHGGVLMGVLSARDVALVSAVDGLDPATVTVEEAMSPYFYAAPPETPLICAVSNMLRHGHSCLVVMEDDHVVGILTSSDALSLLRDRLEQEGQRENLTPSQVRERILSEHRELRVLLDLTERAVDLLLATDGDEQRWRTLRRRAKHLYRRLSRHIETENRILAPALRQADGYGDVREQQLLDEHKAQRQELDAALMLLDDQSQSRDEVAEAVRKLVGRIRADMQAEEKQRLDPKLLTDDIVITDFYAG